MTLGFTFQIPLHHYITTKRVELTVQVFRYSHLNILHKGAELLEEAHPAPLLHLLTVTVCQLPFPSDSSLLRWTAPPLRHPHS